MCFKSWISAKCEKRLSGLTVDGKILFIFLNCLKRLLDILFKNEINLNLIQSMA